jgi:hypothetical protein
VETFVSEIYKIVQHRALPASPHVVIFTQSPVPRTQEKKFRNHLHSTLALLAEISHNIARS